MTPKERAAMQQALEALESYSKSDYIKKQHPKRRANGEKAITALREALAEQVHTPYCKQAPMCKTPCGNSDCVEQAEQEPVIGAYEVVNEKGDEWSLVYPAAVHRYKSIPEERITQTFYATPVRTKDLMDYEINNAWNSQFEFIDRCRAVIAADREKNK